MLTILKHVQQTPFDHAQQSIFHVVATTQHDQVRPLQLCQACSGVLWGMGDLFPSVLWLILREDDVVCGALRLHWRGHGKVASCQLTLHKYTACLENLDCVLLIHHHNLVREECSKKVPSNKNRNDLPENSPKCKENLAN